MILNELKADANTIQKLKNNFQIQDLSEDQVKQAILDFQRLKANLQIKDIFQYPNWPAVKNRIISAQQTKTQQRKIAKTDPKSLYQDQNVIVYMPLTHGQSCQYAKGAKWCTAQSSNPGTWSSYHQSKNVAFYYVRNKNKQIGDSQFMVRVAVYPDGKKQVYDYNDKKVSFPTWLNHIEKIFQSLTKQFIRDRLKNTFRAVMAQQPNGNAIINGKRYWLARVKDQTHIFDQNLSITFSAHDSQKLSIGDDGESFILGESRYGNKQFYRVDQSGNRIDNKNGLKQKIIYLSGGGNYTIYTDQSGKTWVQGKDVKSDVFDSVQLIKDIPYFYVKRNGKIGILNKDLQLIIKPQYKRIKINNRGSNTVYFLASKDKGQQVIFDGEGKGGGTVQNIIDDRMSQINDILGLTQRVQYNRLAQLRGNQF